MIYDLEKCAFLVQFSPDLKINFLPIGYFFPWKDTFMVKKNVLHKMNIVKLKIELPVCLTMFDAMVIF